MPSTVADNENGKTLKQKTQKKLEICRIFVENLSIN